MEKSKMKIWKKFLIIFLIILLIFIIITLRKFIILANMEKVSKDIINSNNYYVELHSLQSYGVSISKSYNKDSRYLTIMETFDSNVPETRKLTIYNDEEGEIGIIQSGESKVAILDGSLVGGQIGINAFSTYGSGFWAKMQMALMSRITTEECSNKECYLIELSNGWKIWIDKESGLILREINGGYVTEFIYKFNTVKDSDIVKPDISDCKIQESN